MGVVRTGLARVFGRITTSPQFQRVVPRGASAMDQGLSRLTGGRLTVSQLLVPTLVLTVTGARSGEPRTTALATLPEPDGSFLVVGSNAGLPKHPAWTANLLAHPDAQVVYKGRSIPVEGRLLEGAERGAAWQRLVRVWPPYERYAEAAGGRELRVFRLVPRAAP